MDKFPLLLEGRPAGELTVEREKLYTCLTARCPLPEGLWCAWAVGEKGELRLGVLEPQGGCGMIRRRVSSRQAAPIGRILRGEVRPRGGESHDASGGARPQPEAPPAPRREPEKWASAAAPERLFHTPWLRQRLKGRQGVLTGVAEGVCCLALPWDTKQPFPLPPLFCFAELRRIGQELYAVFFFDSEERPVF